MNVRMLKLSKYIYLFCLDRLVLKADNLFDYKSIIYLFFFFLILD
jgi:hypothetical protein